MRHWGRLIWAEARHHPLALPVLALLCAIGAGGMALATGLVDHMASIRLRAVVGSSEERTLRVRAPEPSLGLSFERRLLSDADLDFLTGLPGVASHRVVSGLPLPASMRVRIPAMIDARYDITLYTLDDDAVDPALAEDWQRDDDLVPMILNPRLIALYNLGFADRYRTPRLQRQALVAIPLPLEIGRDMFGSLPNPITDRIGVVIGYSDDLPVWGAGIPHRIAAQWLPRLFPDGPPEGTGPVLATLRFATLDALVAGRAAIRDRGLPLEGETALAEAILHDRRLSRGINAGLLALIGVIVALATGCLASAMLSLRRRNLALMRSLGAGFHHLLFIYALPLAASAGIGALAGSLGATLILPALAENISATVPVDLDGLEATVPRALILWPPLLAMVIAILTLIPILWRTLRRDLLAELRTF